MIIDQILQIGRYYVIIKKDIKNIFQNISVVLYV